MDSNDPKIEQIISDHNRFCGCDPEWSQGKWGLELKCSADGSLLWWPTPDLSGLTNEQKLVLTLGLPMKYDVDAKDIDEYLFDGGFVTVTPDNFTEAVQYVTRQLEKALWEDNVAKQLLGRLVDGDLAGDITPDDPTP